MKLHMRLFMIVNGHKLQVESEPMEIQHTPTDQPFDKVIEEVALLEQEINKSGRFRAHLSVSS